MTTKSKYQIWLTFNAEKDKIQIPVLPEAFSFSNGSKDTSVDIVGLGEILIAQNRPAFEISFSSFFPAAKFTGVQAKKVISPLYLRNKILKWKNSKKPVHLIVTGLGLNYYCRITNFKTTEKGGDVGTIYYDITLKEYRAVSVRTVKLNTKTSKASVSKNKARTSNKVTPKTYTVKRGDSLWSIAQRLYGDGSKYMKIYNANKALIGKNKNIIHSGMVLKIPS